MLASTIGDESSPSCDAIIDTGNITTEGVGSDRYKSDHMGMIFQEGLSFSGFERNKVFLGKAGGYVDLSSISGADSESDCRAVLVADFDDDGDCDVFVNAIQRDCHHLFRNDLPRDNTRRSIKVRLRATKGQRDAVGAIVKITSSVGTQARVLSCGSGFESQNADEFVFGLGVDDKARFSVRWPGRETEDFGMLAADGRYLLVEGTGEPAPFGAKTFKIPDPSPRGVKVQVGDSMASLDVTTVDGKPHKVGLTADIPVLVNFWSTTCRSCLAEMPELVRLHAEKKYRVVAVSLDPDSRVAVVDRIKKKLGMNFEVFRVGDAQVDKLFDTSRLGIPVTFVLDKNGRVERILQGRVKKGDL